MNTIRIFHSDVYQRSVEATVLAVRELDGRTAVVCDRTVFFPEGGGQPSDLGTIARSDGGEPFRITDVQEDSPETEILHFVEAPADAFSVSDAVTLTLDWEWRFRNMQRHAGEHILSGALYRLYGIANKGFHMGENYITIDLAEKNITQEMLDRAEDLANEIIARDVPITVFRFENAEEASTMPVRKKIDLAGRISVVTAGSKEDPDDCVACCGTHPSGTGQIALIKIYKFEPNKGMTRVYFDCGKAALLRCREEMALLRTITARFSSGNADILHKLDKRDKADAALRAELARLTAYVRAKEAERLAAALTEAECFYAEATDLLEPNELLKLGFSVVEQAAAENKLLLLEHSPSHTVFLLSRGTPNCGALVKEYAPACGGRGGGRADNARAVFEDRKAIESFSESLRNARSAW